MITLARPDAARIQSFLAGQADLPFSYPGEGLIDGRLPAGFVWDHHRQSLGRGQAAFDAACDALRRWEMFRLGWVELCFPETPIEVGAVVGVLARVAGLWSLNACRVVDVVDEAGPVRRFGFTYGTLPGHVECGEERFLVEWNPETDSVEYDLRACSRPNHWTTRLGKPIARRLQKRFARGSMEAMASAVARRIAQ